MAYNYKKAQSQAVPNSSLPSSDAETTKNKNVNVTDASDPNKKNPEDDRLKQQFDNLIKAKKINVLYQELAENTSVFETIKAQFNSIVDKSPFFKSVPRSGDPCAIISEMASAETTFDDIESLISETYAAYQNYYNSFNKILKPYQDIYSQQQKYKNLPQFAAQIKQFNTEIAKFNSIQKENELFVRRTQQFRLVAPDLQKFFQVCSIICATKKRYDRFFKLYKTPDLRDWSSLINYYNYAIALLKVMAPKAVSVFPKNSKVINSYYIGLVEDFTTQLREIQSGPARNYFGTQGK